MVTWSWRPETCGRGVVMPGSRDMHSCTAAWHAGCLPASKPNLKATACTRPVVVKSVALAATRYAWRVSFSFQAGGAWGSSPPHFLF